VAPTTAVAATAERSAATELQSKGTPRGVPFACKDGVRVADYAKMPATPEQLRVILVDDHPVYREGLAKLLRESGVDVIAQAGNGPDAMSIVEDTAPDVVVMDLNMPGMSGVEVTRKLVERTPASRVLVVSVSAQEEDVTEAILAGASGYVLKDGPVEEVVAGIEAAANGESLISPRIATMLLRKMRLEEPAEPDAAPRTPLSERELQVLRLVAEGKGNQEIGEALYIGQSTVRNHISSILMKLQVENRVQAAVRAVRDRMV
jgi:DNA-binding NarL/FixJ family response regulator